MIPPILAFGLGVVIYLDVRSWVIRVLIIVPIAFAGSLLLKYLLARFGRFQALDKQ